MEAATVASFADVALGRLPIDASGVRCKAELFAVPAMCAILGLAGCARSTSDPAADAPASAASAGPAASWSREALAPHRAGTDPIDPAVMGSIDRDALDDLVAAAPKLVPSPTAADGGTTIGAETTLPEPSARAAESAAPDATHAPRVVVGTPTLQAAMANPAIERAARAQLYWNLVQRCRDKDGKILPADAIAMRFSIDADGYIARSSIVATARSAEHTEAAHCMRRELSTATFRAPAATWGHPGGVQATLPSVD